MAVLNRLAYPIARDGWHSGQVSEFAQGQPIRDYIFPILRVSQTENGVRLERFFGTGFLVGQRGLALTAGHVAASMSGLCAAAFATDDGWSAYAVRDVERHPEHDVAALQLEPLADGTTWNSIIEGAAPDVRSSFSYKMWGYPYDAYAELEQGGQVLPRPDLVYSEGHVRRRFRNVPLPSIEGSLFLELSQVAGEGCSGSPVLSDAARNGSNWLLAGIYLGERVNDRATSVGYAVPIDAFITWKPDIAGADIGTLVASSRPVT